MQFQHPAGLPDTLPTDQTLIMGILNVTPDSFSDGGEHFSHEAAIAHGKLLLQQGAHILDIGGESTRPGAQRVSEEEELRRVVPVVRALAAEGAVISVDTMRASVAQATLDAGALIINDVSGGLADERMATVCATARTSLGTPPVVVVMHWRGHADVATSLAHYDDASRDSAAELAARLQAFRDAGVPNEHLVVDPGLGFSKTAQQNWEVFADWEAMRSHGLPILIGTSRKRFLRSLEGDRDAATAASSAISAAEGAWAVRVHNVEANRDAVAVGSASYRARRTAAGTDGTPAASGTPTSTPRSTGTAAPAETAHHTGEPPILPHLPQLDVITLRGVSAWGYHGVLEHEQRLGQQFAVDARLHLDTRAAGHDDALTRTVNYADVASTIVDTIEGTRFDLLEALAQEIADRILFQHILVRRLDLTLHKPSAPLAHPFTDVQLQVTREAPMVEAVIALGANLGSPEQQLRAALESLREEPGIEVLAAAPVVRTAPVGGVAQNDFLNTVVRIRTSVGPWTLLELCHRLERAAGRERSIHWGPRTLDADLITYGDLQWDDPALTLPHPRAHERAFVLQPWLAIDPDAELPGYGQVGPLVDMAPDREGLAPGPEVPGFGRP